MVKKEHQHLIFFGCLLVLFAVFSTKIGFHDSYEYINIAKNFAGIKNINLFSGHALIYPALISLFLKVWPSFIMLKIVNILWVFLIGVVLLFWLKNKTAFILFAFSPLTWYVSIQTTPVLPATFVFLLSFIFFYKKDSKHRLLYSGLFLGIACAFYTPMILIGTIFILVYFWKNSFVNVVKYVVAIFIGFLPRGIQEYYLFKMPFYSLIRYFGNNFMVFLGLNPLTKGINFLSNFWILSIVVLISPFLFKICKINFNKYKKHLIFLSISGLIFLLRVQQLKYFLILSPIILILLSKSLNDKEIKINNIISTIFIIVLIFSFFGINGEILIQRDLKQINQDFEVDYVIAGPSEATVLAAFWWKDNPRFVWWEDYEASIENKTIIRSYKLGVEPKLKLKSDLEIVANFKRTEDITYENYVLVLRKDAKKPNNFKLNRCYKELCVYNKA
ncbi:MAG: hypothetical protein KKF48_03320 [Nanoarchaeota archaeon]|nr:hypothetical protein [Nanoarchaeota archaeon]MBU1028049.1 hypothetical protein [Nanoarchaeota archaeon]